MKRRLVWVFLAVILVSPASLIFAGGSQPKFYDRMPSEMKCVAERNIAQKKAELKAYEDAGNFFRADQWRYAIELHEMTLGYILTLDPLKRRDCRSEAVGPNAKMLVAECSYGPQDTQCWGN